MKKYRPDMLKIYPTLVVEGTALYQQFKLGEYKPYDLDQLKEILCNFKSRIPPWIRIMRIQREIPKEEIAEGTRAGNLRQIVRDEMERRNLKCRCIRCREVGHKKHEQEPSLGMVKLKRVNYNSSGGLEIFVSYENESTDTLHGFLRLRIPSGNEHRPEIRSQNCALVRELHVYGTVVPVGEKGNPTTSQHKGMGSRLLLEVEAISREYSRRKLVVISAVGTREYLQKARLR